MIWHSKFEKPETDSVVILAFNGISSHELFFFDNGTFYFYDGEPLSDEQFDELSGWTHFPQFTGVST